MEMRTQHKDAFMEKHGVKLGFMSGFVKVMMAFFAFMDVQRSNHSLYCCRSVRLGKTYVETGVL